MQDPEKSIPACFSISGVKKSADDPSSSITKSGENAFISVYRARISDQCRSITVSWCKNFLFHGLSVSVHGEDCKLYSCRVELKSWWFWKKQGSRSFLVEGKKFNLFWDLRSAKFNGEIEPISDYYVAVVCDGEVVLLLGNMCKEAYRKTCCRPCLIDPILISRKEHIFGRKKFVTRVKFHEKGSFHEIFIECKNRNGGSSSKRVEPEMEIRIDGNLVIHVEHLQWKFRGNESIHLNKGRIEVYWDVYAWLFSPGLRHGLFIFKPASVSSLSTSPLSSKGSSSSISEGLSSCGSVVGTMSEFSLFLYAWRVD